MSGFILAMPVDAIGKLIVGLATLVLFLVFVLMFVIGGKRQSNPRAQAKAKQNGPKFSERPRATPPPTRPQPVRNDEIQDFLRRAAGQRKELAANRAEPARPERAAPASRAAVTRPPKSLRATDSAGAVDSVEAGREPTLSQGVASRLSTRQFDDRAAHLSDDLARADLERERHLKRKFGAQVGRLADTAALAGERTTDTAATIESTANSYWIVLTPESARQAFLLSEIFNRPVDRW